jgi:hypothetical protein
MPDQRPVRGEKSSYDQSRQLKEQLEALDQQIDEIESQRAQEHIEDQHAIQ